MRSRAGEREEEGVMTPAETISENASAKSMLADGQNDADVSAKSVEKIDDVVNRAFDELDKLSASLMSKREAYAGLTPDESGPAGLAKSVSSALCGASALAKSKRPASKKVRHPRMSASSTTPPSNLRSGHKYSRDNLLAKFLTKLELN